METWGSTVISPLFCATTKKRKLAGIVVHKAHTVRTVYPQYLFLIKPRQLLVR